MVLDINSHYPAAAVTESMHIGIPTEFQNGGKTRKKVEKTE